MAQSVHGGMITVVARRADRLRQAATLLQQLQFDAGTLHGCQHAITDCPSPPSWLHLDAVKVTFSFGALVRHQAGALGLCLWEWTWNFSFNVRTKIIFYSLTFQSPTGKSSVGGLWYLIYKKPMVCTLHGRVLETETKVSFKYQQWPTQKQKWSMYFYPLSFPDLSSKQKDIKLAFCSPFSCPQCCCEMES